VSSKLAVYHKLFKRYLPQLQVGDPYAAFDESEGVSDYFHVTAGNGVVECILRDVKLSEVEGYLSRLPSVEEQALVKAVKCFDLAVKKRCGAGYRLIEADFSYIAEKSTARVVYEGGYVTGNEVVDIDFFNKVLMGVLAHASRH
jgi:hypothetical protein